jgi:O-antigen biosynthesis protein
MARDPIMTIPPHPAERLGAEYRVVGPLPTARAGLPLFLRVTVCNTGAASWPDYGPNPINLSYHWLDRQGRLADFEGVRTALPASLQPGEAAELELLVEPPPQPGDYLLALDLVEEGVGWFSLRGVPPLQVALQVASGPRNAPRVCLISSLCLVNDAVGNHIVNQLRSFQARGYQALIVVEDVDRRHPVELRQYMAALSYTDLANERDTPLTRRAIEHLRSSDIYIFHYAIHYGLFKMIADINRGVVIMDYHGVTPPHLWDTASDGYHGLVEGQRQIRLVRYADYAITHSSYTRDELLASGGIGPERVQVMPYAVEVGTFRPGPRDADLVSRYGLDHGPVLLYVGRMAANKRIMDLVRALPAVLARYPGATLLLVGDDRTAPHVSIAAAARSEAAALGCADRVIFTGPVAHVELGRFYNTCDVYVTSSLHEGFCIPVVEAMGCGLPVVATDATALPETIGDAGLTFRPEDPADLASKVLAILDSRTERQSTREDQRIVIT